MLKARDKSRDMLEGTWDKIVAMGFIDSDDEQAAPEPHIDTDPSPSGDRSEVDAEEEPAQSEPASLEGVEEEQTSRGTGKGPSAVPNAAHGSSEHMAAGAEAKPAAEKLPKADEAPAVSSSAADVGHALHSSTAPASAAAAAGVAHSSAANLTVANAGERVQEPSLASASRSVSHENIKATAEEPKYLAEARRITAEECAGALPV